jgi:hypothetical protein
VSLTHDVDRHGKDESTEMITSNVLARTLHLRHADAVATGVVIDVDGRSYVVTARHFAEAIKEQTDIHLFHDKQWKTLPVKLVGHAAGEIDLSVLAPPLVLCPPSVPLPPDMGGLIYGQDAYFLGFPYGSFGNVGELNRGLPLPFVRKAIVSCMEHDPSGVRRVYLDGHNNRGFSGGPVVFKEPGSQLFKLAAIVSGYRYSEEPIYQGEAKLPLSYRENTGIVLAYGIQHAVELARGNPVGPAHAV